MSDRKPVVHSKTLRAQIAELSAEVAALRAGRDAARERLRIAQAEILNEDKDLVVALRRAEADRDSWKHLARARDETIQTLTSAAEGCVADRDTLATMLRDAMAFVDKGSARDYQLWEQTLSQLDG